METVYVFVCKKKMTALRTGDTLDIFEWNTIIKGNND